MEDEEIKLPEFDEKKFKEAERRKGKTSVISFLFGIVMAVISRFLWSNMNAAIGWPLIFLFAVASIGFLARILKYVKVDIKSFSKKEWLGSISLYFFTWLAFFILFMNPPFYDASPPKIEVSVLPLIQEAGQNASIFARITDNAGIKNVEINLSGIHHMNRYGECYVFNFSGNSKTSFTINAIDINGHRAIYSGTISFRHNVIYMKEKNGSKINSAHSIKIWVLKNISREKFRVYTIVNGKDINATYFGEEGEYYIYKTSPMYEGWKSGENNFQACVEVIHYMRGSKTRLSAVIKGPKYIFNVEGENISTLASPTIKDLPRPKSLRTPGFEMIVFIMATGIIALIRRRKK